MPRRKSKDRLATLSPTVSGRWLLATVAGALLASAVCAWGALCILFWQGSWQLLYHPTSTVTRTPANLGLPFDAIGFAADEAGLPRLKGWWIPAASDARYTVVYLHGENGNIGDTLDVLAALHAAGANVLAFDYRGYGQSQFAHPSEARWREDAESALQYLTGTRHLPAGSIVLDGHALGANLALEIAAAHPELAGVVIESPLDDPVNAIFSDSRARLVPARLLVRDRYEILPPARLLEIQSLLLLTSTDQKGWTDRGAIGELALRSSRVKRIPFDAEDGDFQHILAHWLNNLHR